MARVKRTTLVPWIAVVVPTAQMSVAETAEILDSPAFAKLVPDGTAGTGTGTTDQAVPSQCSASGRASLPWPTAQALAGPKSTTSYSDASLPPLAAAGVGTMVHAVPSQCAARVSWLAALMLFVLPTAQASFGPLAETPSRRSSWRTMFVVGTCCHSVHLGTFGSVELVVSELVTNAVKASTDQDQRPHYTDEHGLACIHLRMSTDRRTALVE